MSSISVDEALNLIEAQKVELDVEPVSIQQAVGRVLAQDVPDNEDLKPGMLITPKEVCELAQAGCVVPVVKKLPRIGVMVVGEKPVVPGNRFVYEANGFQLRAILQTMALRPSYYGALSHAEIGEAFSRGMKENQILILCGIENDWPPLFLPEITTAGMSEPISIDMGSDRYLLLAEYANGACFILPGDSNKSRELMDLVVKVSIHKLMGCSP